MKHPYNENQDKKHRDMDLDEIVNGVVEFGSSVGSSVLGSIADALQSAVDSVSAAANQPVTLPVYRRRLDKKLSDGWGGYLAMAICGGIFGASFLIAAVVMGILSGVDPASLGMTAGEAQVFPILTACFTLPTIGFGAMFGFGLKGCRYYSRLRQYLRQMRDWSAPVADIARGAVQKPAQVLKDLRKATANGHLGAACLDQESRTLYLDETLYDPTPAPRPMEEPKTETITEQEKFRREGVEFLSYLRSCKGKLPADADVELTAMQKNCGAIMGFIHNHPEQLPRVRRFQEYYLPTTRKLLDTALGLGEADVSNAQTIRRDITGILHTLNTAYTKLYDTLLQDVSMDISTEIDTLETMLRQDGLTHDFQSDFGVQ